MAYKVLIEKAREAIRLSYREDYREIGAALVTRSGRVFAAVNVDANIGRIAVCAEAVAIGDLLPNKYQRDGSE